MQSPTRRFRSTLSEFSQTLYITFPHRKGKKCGKTKACPPFIKRLQIIDYYGIRKIFLDSEGSIPSTWRMSFFFLNAGPQVISINIVWGILTWSYFALPHPTPKQNCHICCEHSNFCVLNEDSGTSILYRCARLVVILILIGDKQILNVVEFSVETCQCLQTHAQSFWKLSTNFASHPVGKIGKVGKRVEFLYMFGLENVET